MTDMRFLISSLLLAAMPQVGLASTVRSPVKPPVDPQTVVNRSYNFLKEREPEMTETEYALYDRLLYMVYDRPDFALGLLESMMDDGEDESAAFKFALGNVYLNEERYEQAEKSYRGAVEQFPTFLRAWVNLGVLYYTTERYEEAIPCFTRALSLGDREAQTFGMLGYSLRSVGNMLGAEAAYLQAFALDPRKKEWIEALLSLYLESEQNQRAESLARQLVELEPREAEHWTLYAHLLLKAERPLEALVSLELATRMGVDTPEALTLLGDLYATQQLHAEALSTFQRLDAGSPALGHGRLLNLAHTLLAAGRSDEAERTLAQLPDTLPDALQVQRWHARSILAQSRGDLPEARESLAQALALEPLNGDLLLALGRNLAEQGEEDRATFILEQAAALPTHTYDACLHLANLAVRARHYGEAVRRLEIALALQPSSDFIREYLAKLRPLTSPTP